MVELAAEAMGAVVVGKEVANVVAKAVATVVADEEVAKVTEDSVAGKEAVDVEADEEAGAVVDKAVAESKGGGKAGNVEAVEPRVVEGVVEGIRCAAAGSFSWTGRLQIEGRALANP